MDIVISTGNSRLTRVWKMEHYTADSLCERLQEPIRTAETVDQYAALPKTDRDKIKDHGGFVGGKLRGVRRLANAMEYRSLITLDLDDCPEGYLQTLLARLHYDSFVYSTHSHTPEAPRFRLLVFLTRNISPDAFNMLPAYREQIVVEIASIREGEMRRIDALIGASEEAEKRMEEQLATIQEAGEDTALLEKQITEEHARRDTLLLERAGHANKEVHLRFLLELIEMLEPITTSSFDGRTRDGCGGRVTVKRTEHEPGACADEDEFFSASPTDHPPARTSIHNR